VRPAAGSDARGPAADTIFALSSGSPPAGVAVVRISGLHAGGALDALSSGKRPDPRRAVVRRLCDPATGELLDRALVLWLPAPHTVTGEDMVELHLHGSRAVVAAVMARLGCVAGLREAGPGEFTRRAFSSGLVDLVGIEALGDLLAAQTEGQRRNAMLLASGSFSRAIDGWQEQLLVLSARVEAILDFSDEDDVAEDESGISAEVESLRDEIAQWLAKPRAERLRDGVRVVLAGPPNAGKSTLLNALCGREAAIVTAIAGTTRDLIEVPVILGGVAFLFVDSAGLRSGADEAEAIGIDRARQAMDAADILLWLGAPHDRPDRGEVIVVGAQADRVQYSEGAVDICVSAVRGDGLDALVDRILIAAKALLPAEGEAALNERQRGALAEVEIYLAEAMASEDLLIVSEGLRGTLAAIDRLTGRAGTEAMFDRLFSGFCIGK
jgi:tRNA modification GTPase